MGDAIACSICFDEINLNDETSSEIYKTPCNHLFHRLCISNWLSSHHNCPNCRCQIYDNPFYRIPPNNNNFEFPENLHTFSFDANIQNSNDDNLDVIDRIENINDYYQSLNNNNIIHLNENNIDDNNNSNNNNSNNNNSNNNNSNNNNNNNGNNNNNSNNNNNGNNNNNTNSIDSSITSILVNLNRSVLQTNVNWQTRQNINYQLNDVISDLNNLRNILNNTLNVLDNFSNYNHNIQMISQFSEI